jgi:hypothetical protein
MVQLPETIRRCPLKAAVALAALMLLSLSLVLPVFESTNQSVPGYVVLFATFAWGISTAIGMSFAIMNLGLLYLFWWNVTGNSSRLMAMMGLMLSLLLFARVLTAQDWTAAGALGIGVPVWFQSMIVMSVATCLPCADGRSSVDDPHG